MYPERDKFEVVKPFQRVARYKSAKIKMDYKQGETITGYAHDIWINEELKAGNIVQIIN